MKAKTLLLNLALAAASLAVCAAVTEIAIRVWKRDIAFQPDPQLIRSLRPNVRRDVWSFDTPEVLATKRRTNAPQLLGLDYTNNVGLRMKDDVTAGSDEQRILLLGDSFVEAEQVPDAERFYELAQRGLDQGAHGRRWRIVNAGIQNGAPSQYILQLRRYLPQFHPAVVIVFLAPNDAEDDFSFEDRNGYEFDERGMPLQPITRGRLWLLQKFWTLRYGDVAAQRRLPWLEIRIWPPRLDGRRHPRWVGMLCGGGDPEEFEWFRSKTGPYVAELKRMAEGAGARFAVVLTNYMWVFPDEPSAAPALDSSDQRQCTATHGDAYRAFIHTYLSDRGILFDDPYETLATAKTRTPAEKLWNFYDYHFSPAGHAVMATELLRFLRQRLAID